ncbi:hypothetical protein SO802_031423 [Lithocarpus litseifolius]|uniref:Uncharacterized protein n=1 Tax=Lithocarpus litseifolius TaxID=425828 RepID=A0AAW2BKZ1_9ROSI
MEAYRRFKQFELFLSLKRDLAMVKVEAHSCVEIEKMMGAFKEEHKKLMTQLTVYERDRLSAKAGLKNTEA